MDHNYMFPNFSISRANKILASTSNILGPDRSVIISKSTSSFPVTVEELFNGEDLIVRFGSDSNVT